MASVDVDALVGRTRSGRLVQRTIALLWVAIIVLVPLVVVIVKTFQPGLAQFFDALGTSQARAAYKLTAEVAISAVVLNIVFGVGMSMLLARYRFPGRRLLSGLIDLPIAVSPIVVGIALVLVYSPYNGWFGKGLASDGIKIIFATPGMIMATVFVSMPLILREIVPVLEEEGTDQEQAARVLGANAIQRFVRITFPTIRAALAYGIVLGLARSIGEYGALVVVSGNVSGSGQTQTVPLVIGDRVTQLEGGYYPLAFVLILITVAAIVVVGLRRKKENLR